MGQRWGAADVHHREAQGRRQVVGDPRGDRAAEEDRVAVGGNALALPVPALEGVLDHQRGQAQGDQGGDPVTNGQPEGGLGADLLDGPDQHPPGAGDRVLHLAAGGDDLEHLTAYGVAVVAMLALHLAERRGVEVQGLDPDPDLTWPWIRPLDVGAAQHLCGGSMTLIQRSLHSRAPSSGRRWLYRSSRCRIGARRDRCHRYLSAAKRRSERRPGSH